MARITDDELREIGGDGCSSVDCSPRALYEAGVRAAAEWLAASNPNDPPLATALILNALERGDL